MLIRRRVGWPGKPSQERQFPLVFLALRSLSAGNAGMTEEVKSRAKTKESRENPGGAEEREGRDCIT